MKIISCIIPQIDYSTLKTNNPKKLEIIFTDSLNNILPEFSGMNTRKVFNFATYQQMLIV